MTHVTNQSVQKGRSNWSQVRMHTDPQTMIDMINPEKGWVIGGAAVATTWLQAQIPQIDLSWAELLYSVAAVIYAVAALVKTLREKARPAQKSLSAGHSDDTIDTK